MNKGVGDFESLNFLKAKDILSWDLFLRVYIYIHILYTYFILSYFSPGPRIFDFVPLGMAGCFGCDEGKRIQFDNSGPFAHPNMAWDGSCCIIDFSI